MLRYFNVSKPIAIFSRLNASSIEGNNYKRMFVLKGTTIKERLQI